MTDLAATYASGVKRSVKRWLEARPGTRPGRLGRVDLDECRRAFGWTAFLGLLVASLALRGQALGFVWAIELAGLLGTLAALVVALLRYGQGEPARDLRLILVDRDLARLRRVAELARGLGYRVEAYSGVGGLSAAMERAPADLVVTGLTGEWLSNVGATSLWHGVRLVALVDRAERAGLVLGVTQVVDRDDPEALRRVLEAFAASRHLADLLEPRGVSTLTGARR